MSPAGTGWNQTRAPSPPRTITPFWVGPCCGVRKMSPGAAPAASLVTSTAAGVRSGRDRKVSTSPGTRGAAGSGIDGIEPAGVAIVKRNVPALAPRTCSLVRTVTTSPAANGLAGRKLPPFPSESATSRPA